jgi:hypothetical protein
MSQTPSWVGSKRMKIGFPTIYDYLVDEEKLFTNKWNLLVFGMVYGILLDKKVEKSSRTALGPIATITDQHIKNMFDFCYMILNDGSGEDKVYQKMCDYADGGVSELNKIYKENKSFTLPSLIRDAEKIWKDRAPNLQNINLAK